MFWLKFGREGTFFFCCFLEDFIKVYKKGFWRKLKGIASNGRYACGTSASQFTRYHSFWYWRDQISFCYTRVVVILCAKISADLSLLEPRITAIFPPPSPCLIHNLAFRCFAFNLSQKYWSYVDDTGFVFPSGIFGIEPIWKSVVRRSNFYYGEAYVFHGCTWVAHERLLNGICFCLEGKWVEAG